jgi:BirA family biotin operon repressor/biotin-[acetyl-CoA-carboxylase] ligase
VRPHLEMRPPPPEASPPPDESRLERWEGLTAAELATRWEIPAVDLWASVGSTNDVARALASTGASPATLVLADAQHAGRGRAGRAWSSPAGLGLYFSFLARPSAGEVAVYPLRLGVAVARALDPWGGSDLSIKWPNDILLHGRKLGGILCEAAWSGGSLEYLIVGIGLNLLHRDEDFPAELRPRATSLLQIGQPPTRLAVADRLVHELRSVIDADNGAVDEAWHLELGRRDFLRGRVVDVVEPESGRALASGVADGISADGSLRVRIDDRVVEIRSGTVRLAEDRPG